MTHEILSEGARNTDVDSSAARFSNLYVPSMNPGDSLHTYLPQLRSTRIIIPERLKRPRIRIDYFNTMHQQISEADLSETLQTIKELRAQCSRDAVDSEVWSLEERLKTRYVTKTSSPTSSENLETSYEEDGISAAVKDLPLAGGRPEGNFWARAGNMWRCVSSSEARVAFCAEPVSRGIAIFAIWISGSRRVWLIALAASGRGIDM